VSTRCLKFSKSLLEEVNGSLLFLNYSFVFLYGSLAFSDSLVQQLILFNLSLQVVLNKPYLEACPVFQALLQLRKQ